MIKNWVRYSGCAIIMASWMATPCLAEQYAPVPQRAPPVPVNQQAMPDRRAALMQTRDLEGQAQIVDGDRLKIGEADVRLFGVVPPQLSASFGPQARALLDNLVTGQVTSCHVRDRDRDGRLLATCRVGTTDMGMELLRHGLAVTARGSLTNTELAEPYLAAEQAAEIQHAGLWSVAITPPAAQLVGESSKTEASAPVVLKSEPPKNDPPKAEVLKAEASKADLPAKEPVSDKDTHDSVTKTIPVHVGAPGLLYTTDLKAERDEEIGFFQHYQILVTGGLIFLTTFGTMLVLVLQRRYEKREEMKAIAAALRGELLAARAVCLTRLKTIHSDEDDRTASWPRLRSTLYQAYVGRLGWLGAQLSRQIASIYGQASDYATYYNNVEEATQAPKRRALQTLAGHIEEVLPRLEWIEVTGRRPTPVPVTVNQPFMPIPVVEETTADVATVDAVLDTPALPEGDTAAQQPASHFLPANLWQAVRQFVHQHLPLHQPANTGGEEQDYDMMLDHTLQPVTFHESAEIESALSTMTILSETAAAQTTMSETGASEAAVSDKTKPDTPANDMNASAASLTTKTHIA